MSSQGPRVTRPPTMGGGAGHRGEAEMAGTELLPIRQPAERLGRSGGLSQRLFCLLL